MKSRTSVPGCPARSVKCPRDNPRDVPKNPQSDDLDFLGVLFLILGAGLAIVGVIFAFVGFGMRTFPSLSMVSVGGESGLVVKDIPAWMAFGIALVALGCATFILRGLSKHETGMALLRSMFRRDRR